MHRRAGFNLYDALAPLASGIVAFAVIDIAFGSRLVLSSEWSVGGGLFVIVAAYVVGQILAAPAAWLYEWLLVGRCLGWPSETLLEVPGGGTARRLLGCSLLCEYYRPLPAEAQESVARRAGRIVSQALFTKAWIATRQEPEAARWEKYRLVFAFCRDIAFVTLLAAIILALSALAGYTAHSGRPLAFLPANPWWKALIFLVVSLGITHRFLKFIRLYTLELLLAFADAPAARK
jgi:hypothetical protein